MNNKREVNLKISYNIKIVLIELNKSCDWSYDYQIPCYYINLAKTFWSTKNNFPIYYKMLNQ